MAFTRKDIVEYYDKTEISYRLWWDLRHSMAMHFGYSDHKARTFRQSLLRFNEVMAEETGVTEDDRVLDAGCGVGGSSIFLAKRYGCRVVGATVCPGQARSARRNAELHGVDGRARFCEMDYCRTAFRSGSFTLVWGLESVCYAESKRAFVAEAYRLLAPGGRLVVADGFASKERYEGREEAIMRGWLDGWAVNHLDTPGQWLDHAAVAGFTDARYRNVTPNVMPSSRKLFAFAVPAMILAKIQYRLGLISKLESMHSVTLYNQYIGLKRGLWEYGIFHAVKP